MTESTDFSSPLKALMQRAEIHSYQALADLAGVSRWQVQQLRAGKAKTMRLAVLLRFAQVLQVSLADFLERFGVSEVNAPMRAAPKPDPDSNSTESEHVEALKQAYRQLQRESAQKLAEARSQFQSESLRTLESWLVQWPLIAARARARGAELPAEKVLPFVRPVETLVADWGVEAIAPVDSQVDYDPQYHQLSGETAQPGERVIVTHSGARHGGKLLHRAKVKRKD